MPAAPVTNTLMTNVERITPYVRTPVELLFRRTRRKKPMHGQVRVRQQSRERQVVALAETLQLVDWALGDAQHSETECGGAGNVVAEVACLVVQPGVIAVG